MRVNRGFRRVIASSIHSLGGRRIAAFALGSMVAAAGAGLAIAQGANEQQIRCMQLQQELVSASQGGGGSSDDVARLDQQIAQNDRVFQGTQAAMQDAGCFESFFIFGKALVRSPKCLKMNDRVEDARRQLAALQQQRAALSGGGGNKRRQAELQDAMARSGCGGQVRAPKRGGGLLDFFGGGQEQEEEQQPETPIYRSIDPNGRYRSVCVRLCDGFFYPISFATYSSRLAQEQEQCQSSCAAPAELYVYRNPGQEIEQAISLNGSAYMDLPVALKLSQVLRERLLLQAGRIQSDRDRSRQQARRGRSRHAAGQRQRQRQGRSETCACAGHCRRYAGPDRRAESISTLPAAISLRPPLHLRRKPPRAPAHRSSRRPPPRLRQHLRPHRHRPMPRSSSVVKKAGKPASPPPAITHLSNLAVEPRHERAPCRSTAAAL